jgi:hypothetical protein
VVRYTHYSLLVFGFARVPIVAWLRDLDGPPSAAEKGSGELAATDKRSRRPIPKALATRLRIAPRTVTALREMQGTVRPKGDAIAVEFEASPAVLTSLRTSTTSA